MKINRRDFAKLAAAATVAPALWIPRRATAATAGFGAAKHVLVLFAQGGFRSHCTFNAVGSYPSVNPFGVHPDVIAGRQWKLGAAVGSDTWGGASVGAVPSFASISGDVTVLGCVDHNPGEPPERDHYTAIRRIATGTPSGQSGLLSLVGKDLPRYAGGFSLSAIPPVEIGPSPFGWGSGDYAPSMPISIGSAAAGLQAGTLPIGKGWKIAAREKQDASFLETSPRSYRKRLGNFILGKKNADLFATLLTDPRLAVVGDPLASDAGFTNEQLLEVLGNHAFPAVGGLVVDNMSWGADVALALRFFGFGSPMAVVRRDMYDMHFGEHANYATRVADLARQLAGLHFLLHRMPHSSGGTYWDHTIVAVVSEFSRNNASENGFNSGEGSDHVEANPGPVRNQAIAMMGGPIAASRGRLIGPTDAQINASDPSQVFTSRALLATLTDALGINRNYFGAQPIQELYS